jgi:hypothetical protein
MSCSARRTPSGRSIYRGAFKTILETSKRVGPPALRNARAVEYSPPPMLEAVAITGRANPARRPRLHRQSQSLRQHQLRSTQFIGFIGDPNLVRP